MKIIFLLYLIFNLCKNVNQIQKKKVESYLYNNLQHALSETNTKGKLLRKLRTSRNLTEQKLRELRKENNINDTAELY